MSKFSTSIEVLKDRYGKKTKQNKMWALSSIKYIVNFNYKIKK